MSSSDKYQRKCDCGIDMKLVGRDEDPYGYGATLQFWCPRCGSLAERSFDKVVKKIHDHSRQVPKVLKKLNKLIWCDPLGTEDYEKVTKLFDRVLRRKKCAR